MFVEDTFTDVDGTALTAHVGELGAAWSDHPATLGAPPDISSTDELRRGAHGASTICYASGVPDTADYEVTADFRYIASGLNCWAGIFARLATGSYDGYLLQYEQWMGARGWVLYSVTGGGYASLQSAAASAPGVATLRVEGDAITVTIDGTPTLAVTNSDHADAGRVGVRFDPGDDGADSIWLDNLTAGPIPAGALSIDPAGIGPGEALGTPTLTGGGLGIRPAGIGSGEILGAATVTGGAIRISPAGIASGETFDMIALLASADPMIAPAALASAEALGTPTLLHAGPAVISVPSIGPSAGVGRPFVLIDEDDTATPRNRFIDPVTGQVYPWPVNHAAEDSIKTFGRRLGRGGIGANGLLVRQPSHPGPVHLALHGSMIDANREQYQQFVTFFDACDDRTLIYIDASGDSYEVALLTFDAHRKINPGRLAGSYFEYSLEVEVLGVNAGPLKGYAL